MAKFLKHRVFTVLKFRTQCNALKYQLNAPNNPFQDVRTTVERVCKRFARCGKELRFTRAYKSVRRFLKGRWTLSV